MSGLSKEWADKGNHEGGMVFWAWFAPVIWFVANAVIGMLYGNPRAGFFFGVAPLIPCWIFSTLAVHHALNVKQTEKSE